MEATPQFFVGLLTQYYQTSHLKKQKLKYMETMQFHISPNRDVTRTAPHLNLQIKSVAIFLNQS